MGAIKKPDCTIILARSRHFVRLHPNFVLACTLALSNIFRIQFIIKIHDLADNFPVFSLLCPKDRNYIGACKLARNPIATTSNPRAIFPYLLHLRAQGQCHHG